MKESPINANLIGARLLDPLQSIDKVSNLYIRSGKIYLNPPEEKSKTAVKEIPLKGHIIIPGAFDMRVHSRIPGTESCETFESISKAASCGGFTGILTMPDTSPCCDNAGTIRYIQDRIKQHSSIPIWVSGALTKGRQGSLMAPLGSLKEAGIVAASDCPRPSINNQIFLNSVQYAKMFDLPVIEYPQDFQLSQEGNAHESPLSLKMGLGGFPRIAEEISVQRAIMVSKLLDVSIHLSSISSAGSVVALRRAKEDGIKITADVTATHLLLNENAISQYDTNAKLTPPLREEGDRIELIKGVLDGSIDAITSGHLPYPSHLKQIEFDKSPPGAIGLETCISASIEGLSTLCKDPYPALVNAICYAPRKVLKLNQHGIRNNELANLTVINGSCNWRYNVDTDNSDSSNSPLNNRTFNTSVVYTVVNGRPVYCSI
jgi:dihydroorotase